MQKGMFRKSINDLELYAVVRQLSYSYPEIKQKAVFIILDL